MASDRSYALRRFFCEDAAALSAADPAMRDPIQLGPEIVRHVRVLRLQTGDHIELFDGRGHRAEAELIDADRARLVRVWSVSPDLPRTHLIQCLPKGAKADDIVRMTTELGVASIHFAFSRHTVVQPVGIAVGAALTMGADRA